MAGLPASKTALLVEKRKQPCSKTRCPLHGCCYMGKLPLFGFYFHLDFAVFLFKITDTLTDQVQNLPITGTAFVLCNIVQFIVELGIDFDSQMLVVFVSHTITTKFPETKDGNTRRATLFFTMIRPDILQTGRNQWL